MSHAANLLHAQQPPAEPTRSNPLTRLRCTPHILLHDLQIIRAPRPAPRYVAALRTIGDLQVMNTVLGMIEDAEGTGDEAQRVRNEARVAKMLSIGVVQGISLVEGGDVNALVTGVYGALPEQVRFVLCLERVNAFCLLQCARVWSSNYRSLPPSLARARSRSFSRSPPPPALCHPTQRLEEAFNVVIEAGTGADRRLPVGWESGANEEGRIYFSNGATGAAVWDDIEAVPGVLPANNNVLVEIGLIESGECSFIYRYISRES